MGKRRVTRTEFFVLIASIVCLTLLIGWLYRVKRSAYLIKYRNDIKNLQLAFQQYAAEFDGHYPSADTWCDSLIKYAGVNSEHLVSSWAGDPMFYDTTDPCAEPNFPVQLRFLREYDDSQGKHHYTFIVQWCHFALNPNVEPDSSGDVVLLFSTQGGWNQCGGPEIFSTENYREIDHVGGYVLLNNGDVKFIKPKDIDKLNWGKKP
ncbi:MAG: hypothetical protein JSV82_03670 [Planctomycetota bacterium]|nr:MAG: hypothetical protein JSV82_03670 [Planctomycetota bacterium]